MAITLEKDQKISLKKSAPKLGEILINLNWSSKESKGFFSSLFSSKNNIDLDLGCLYEMKNGSRGAVQALGKAFGSLTTLPYIALDGDDRTGAAASGENLRINGDEIAKFKRILVFTYIYDGAPNWKDTDGKVTIKYPGSEDIIIYMDEYSTKFTMCALAMLENINDETFSVQKLISFHKGHEAMDRAYNWNLKWTPGTKD